MIKILLQVNESEQTYNSRSQESIFQYLKMNENMKGLTKEKKLSKKKKSIRNITLDHPERGCRFR